MAESSNRQKDIFLQALDLPSPAERAAFLAQACGTDESFRRQVEAMLQAHATPDSFLEKPAAAMGPTIDDPPRPEKRGPSEGPGTRVGPYKLLQKLGEGGMGVVFLAEQQEPVRRMVALKIIKQGMDSGQVVARFESERQALALMDHPNIAKVLDAGTIGSEPAAQARDVAGTLAGASGSSRPYFVMELIKGIPITKFCDQEHLTPRQRLELFIPVCQAVQHAHQKGIIHRDLKPSNVMIALYDGKPVPKVIDFGVAKATSQKLTERTLFTEVGSMVGTLEYMAPEQAELNNLDIDTRADIYALGVLMYELLTGSPPFSAKELRSNAFAEMLRIIREVEPPRPSTKLSSSQELPAIAARRKLEPSSLTRQVQGDLDWIVMKCLEKERSRRYETANAVVQDIQRYLTDEPVLAGPPSAGYRLRKFVKRNRGTVTAASAVLLTLLIGAAVSVALALWAFREADTAEKARIDETKERERAERAERAALGLAKDEKAARKQSDKDKATAQYQALRAESARHVIQLDVALRAWERHDLSEAERALGDVEGMFKQTWEQRHLRDLCRRKARPLVGHTDDINSVAMSADGRRIVSASLENNLSQIIGTVKVWDAATGQVEHTLKGHTLPVTTVAISGDGQRIVTGSGLIFDRQPSMDATVKVWDAETGQLKHALKGNAVKDFSHSKIGVLVNWVI